MVPHAHPAASCDTMSNPRAIEVRRVTFRASRSREPLVSEVSFSVRQGSFVAVIGLSGCGKSTLIRLMSGVQASDHGSVLFSGHEIGEIKRHYPLAVGYISQTGIFHGELTVREILGFAVSLRLPPSVNADVRGGWLAHIVELARLEPFLDQRYATLSGGQMRRVALAEELIGDPQFVLLDELTSGLDLFSDNEIMLWLRQLAHDHGKTIVLVTHAVEHLAYCDALLLLHAGKLVHYGTLEELLSSQEARSLEEVYGRCILGSVNTEATPLADEEEIPRIEPLKTERPPNGALQFKTLVARQAKLFLRDRVQLGIQLALMVTFPVMVAVFALSGLPQVRTLNLASDANLVRTLGDKLEYLKNTVECASLISGLVMFQVILLTLMGANNGAREIAKDRSILRRELFAGLSPSACVMSKLLQIALMSALQALLMAWFVKTVCGFPGDIISQFAILFLTTLAMSATCLAISAASSTTERASLLSIYLVGFQLPLSGAALALPDWLSQLCRPFIAAYWGWSGYLQTLHATPYFDVVAESTKTTIAAYHAALLVLTGHTVVALVASIFFLARQGKQAS
jgi:ABC-type multidrug transport system ATPase subunit